MVRPKYLYLFLIAILSGYSFHNLQDSLEISASAQQNTAAICAIQKGALRYIDEWIDYNVAIGFEKIYIYDNSDDFELQRWHNSTTSIVQQRVEIKHFPGLVRQNEAYSLCAKRIQTEKIHAWIAFFDLDEFLVIRNTAKYPRIMDLLDDLPRHIGGLAVNWVMFSLNNQTTYESKPVTLRFQKRIHNATDSRVKTIARAEHIKDIVNPHYVRYKWFSFAKSEDTSGNIVKGPWNPLLTNDVVVLHHYRTKSLEEYKERCHRGRADLPEEVWKSQLPCKSDSEVFDMYGRNENVSDDAAWQLLKERVPRYAHFYGSD